MSRRVVIVEHNPEFLSMVSDFLAAKQYEVLTARTSEEGLVRVRESQPDLILLARELPQEDGRPGIEGLRLLKALKQDRELARIPVIFMAGQASEADFERYRKLPFSAQDYLKKPFEDTDLLRKIENLIGFELTTESMREIKSQMEQSLQPGLDRFFRASLEGLGEENAAAARRELSDLMAQVGKELERQEKLLRTEAKAAPRSQPAEDLAAEVKRLRAELDEAREQLAAEQARARELRAKWKKALQAMEARWKESEERELRMREEMEAMRLRFSDLELDHTMQIERIQQERRRLEEEVLDLRERMKLYAELPANFLEELKHAAAILDSLLQRTRRSDQSPK